MTARQIKRRRMCNMTSRLHWVAWLFGRADDVRLFVAPLSAHVIVDGVADDLKWRDNLDEGYFAK
jgi:hypothetical protein